jgi:2-polyprenyl-3-methyl-5-hydroxy-6-metoxy-1,4-benzoquinol methylase
MTRDVSSARVDAARASGGISNSAIHRAVIDEVRSTKISGRALDFGAGEGALTRLLLALPQVSAVDAADLLPYRGLEGTAAGKIVADLNGALPVDAESYQLIVAAEVIEHLENPRAVAREWHRLLAKGGVLVVTTPNNESWRSLISLMFRGHFAAFTGSCYPAHITALLRLDLHRVLAEAGFEEIACRGTGSGGIPGWPRVTWQEASLDLLKGMRFSDNVVCVARKPA